MNALMEALLKRSHDGLVEDFVKLLAEKYLLERKVEILSAPISAEEWDGGCANMGMRSRDSVNEIYARRG